MEKILLIGVGKMGIEYAKVLKALPAEFVAIGRSEEGVKNFKEVTGIEATSGGLASYLSQNDVKGEKAIVAVDVQLLDECAELLINSGIRSILLEKPGGLNLEKLKYIKKIAEKTGSQIFIAYNRRFYASARQAREIIKEDGGALSFIFEFNERIDIVENLPLSEEVKANWFLANSSHVADLAFHLGGKPKEIKAFKEGTLPWHPSGAIFSGAGISQSGAIFSYHANWQSGGRWSVEVMTPKRRLILKPLEELWEQRKGTFEVNKIEIDYSLDKNYKPGINLLTKTFFEEGDGLVTLEEQIENVSYFNRISGEK